MRCLSVSDRAVIPVIRLTRQGLTCTDEHQVGDGGPVELIVGDQGDVPAGGDPGLVRESQQYSVVVSAHQVDGLDVT